MSLKNWSLVCILVVLTGCGAPLKKQAFNKEMAGAIKTVTVTQSPNQDVYEAVVLGHPGMGFEPIPVGRSFAR